MMFALEPALRAKGSRDRLGAALGAGLGGALFGLPGAIAGAGGNWRRLLWIVSLTEEATPSRS